MTQPIIESTQPIIESTDDTIKRDLQPSEIDHINLAKEVLRLAEERPDFIYESSAPAPSVGWLPTCYYVDPDPNYEGCIFGQALINLGVPKAYLENRMTAIVSLLGVEDGIDMLIDAFTSTQSRQDQKDKWGGAVEPIKRYFDEKELKSWIT